MTGLNMSIRVIREQMASALNLLIHLGRLTGGRRRILSIAENIGMQGETIVLQTCFVSTDGISPRVMPWAISRSAGRAPRYCRACKRRPPDHGVHLRKTHARLF